MHAIQWAFVRRATGKRCNALLSRMESPVHCKGARRVRASGWGSKHQRETVGKHLIRLAYRHRQLTGGIGADRITAYQRLSGRTRCTALPHQNGDHTALRRLRFSWAQIRKHQRRNGQPAKLPITPSKVSLHAVKAKIRALCKQAKGATLGQLIDKLNPVLRVEVPKANCWLFFKY
jgi:hypothetical protein